jgi:hypothetical protein
VVKNFYFFVMAGVNETRHSDRIELPKHLDFLFRDECERPVFRQVEAVTALRFVPACHAVA